MDNLYTVKLKGFARLHETGEVAVIADSALEALRFCMAEFQGSQIDDFETPKLCNEKGVLIKATRSCWEGYH